MSLKKSSSKKTGSSVSKTTGKGIVRLLHITTIPITLKFLDGQISHLKEKGFEIIAISAPGDDLQEFGRNQGVNTYGVEMERRITPLKDLKATIKLWRLLSKLKPVIVDAHTPKGGLIGMVASTMASVPVRVYHLHGLPMMTAKGYKYALLRLSEKVSCRLASRVICVSHTLLDEVVERGLCSRKKVKVLHNGSINGVDAENEFNPNMYTRDLRNDIKDEYGLPHDATVIGFVGRIVPDKGIPELMEAWKELRREYRKLHLVLAGETESVQPLSEDTQHILEKDPRIHLLGYVKDIGRVYSLMDLFVFPSYREGFGVSLIEASAMEVPVIATCITGCKNAVLEGVSGTLVPPRDFTALRNAIELYLKDTELREQHGKDGREWVMKTFRQEDIWKEVVSEYEELLDEYCQK